MSTVQADLEAFWTFCIIIATIPFLLEFWIIGLVDIPAQKLQLCVIELQPVSSLRARWGPRKLCPSITTRARRMMGTFAGLLAGLTGLFSGQSEGESTG